MGAHLIVLLHPFIEVGLQFLDGAVDLLAEGDAVELVEQRLVETLNAEPKPFSWTKNADDILAAVQRFCQRTLTVQTKCPETSGSGH